MAKKPAQGPDGKATRWFRAVGSAGLVLSVIAFVFYAAGGFPSGLTPEDSAALWLVPAEEYRQAVELDFGAGWMFSTTDGYAVSTAALALLASTALPVLAVLAISWFRRRDLLYGFIALAIAAILVLAVVR